MKRALPTMASLALGLLATAGCAAGEQPSGASPGPGSTGQAGITARGLGTVTGTPDTVTVVLGVQTQAPSAKAALDANNERATALIEVLKASGVAPADLRTSQLSIYPTYAPTNGRITGYEVSNLVTATMHDVAGAGGMIDAASGAAGDAVRIQQLSFSIDDDSALRAQARADAVRQAQEQARQMAEAAGVALGPIRSITEIPATTPPVPYQQEARVSDGSAPPVEPGTQELAVNVDVVYDVAQ